jgi:uncharacterized protein (TIGR04255 family)
VALRYVNRIELPEPVNELGDYFLTAPVIAPPLPQKMSGLFLRLSIPDPKSGATAIVTEATATAEPGSGKIPMIFDIDVFFEGSFGVDSPDMWQKLEGLAILKNELFFGSLTPKALELFK